jgi:hypothetical protein
LGEVGFAGGPELAAHFGRKGQRQWVSPPGPPNNAFKPNGYSGVFEHCALAPAHLIEGSLAAPPSA